MEMQRVGSFSISDQTVFNEDPAVIDAVMKLLGEVFICSCTHNFGYGRFEYIGMSKHFQEVAEGEEAPRYNITITANNNSTTVKFERKE